MHHERAIRRGLHSASCSATPGHLSLEFALTIQVLFKKLIFHLESPAGIVFPAVRPLDRAPF
jgi:hypothetical protein